MNSIGGSARQEVGISREALAQAIQNVEARKNAAISRATRRRTLVRNLFKSVLLLAVAGALTLALVLLNSLSPASALRGRHPFCLFKRGAGIHTKAVWRVWDSAACDLCNLTLERSK